jgi:hypothetical protein
LGLVQLLVIRRYTGNFVIHRAIIFSEGNAILRWSHFLFSTQKSNNSSTERVEALHVLWEVTGELRWSPQQLYCEILGMKIEKIPADLIFSGIFVAVPSKKLKTLQIWGPIFVAHSQMPK